MAQDSDFRGQLETRIERFVSQRNDLRKQLVEFNHALNSVEKRLETAIEMYRLEFEADPPQIGASEYATSQERAAAETWNDAVEAVLADGPLHINEIWDRVQKRGFRTTAKDPLRALASVLVRHPNAERAAPSVYGLRGMNGSPQTLQQTLVTVGDETPPQSSGDDR